MFTSIGRRSCKRQVPAKRRCQRSVRPAVESLEDRCVPAGDIIGVCVPAPGYPCDSPPPGQTAGYTPENLKWMGHTYEDLYHRAPSVAEQLRIAAALSQDAARMGTATALANSQEARQAAAADDWEEAFQRPADSSLINYWGSQVTGYRVDDAKASIYGSTEFYQRAGRSEERRVGKECRL